MSDYSEHLISMAGGDGDALSEIEARAEVNKYLGKTASQDEAKDTLRLIATIKDQQAKLDRIIELAHWAGKRGWTIHPAEIRTALEAS